MDNSNFKIYILYILFILYLLIITLILLKLTRDNNFKILNSINKVSNTVKPVNKAYENS